MFVWSYATIGKYPQINPRLCGVSKLTSEGDSPCFEWHKMTESGMRDARALEYGEAPWVARLALTYIANGYHLKVFT